VVRSQSYYIDIHPAGHDKGTFVQAMATRRHFDDAVATIATCRTIWQVQKRARPIAMGNDDRRCKKRATMYRRERDEGLAGAIELF